MDTDVLTDQQKISIYLSIYLSIVKNIRFRLACIGTSKERTSNVLIQIHLKIDNVKLRIVSFYRVGVPVVLWRCQWCNRYRRRKWTRRHEFKSWTRLIAFHIALIPLGKVWIQLFSLQLWVNSRADWFLQPWWSN